MTICTKMPPIFKTLIDLTDYGNEKIRKKSTAKATLSSRLLHLRGGTHFHLLIMLNLLTPKL